jgi:hypothetical protein
VHSFRSCVTILGAALLLLAGPAHAHYMHLEPQGETKTAVGSTVTVSIYLHAEADDMIYGWGVSQIFDSTELTRVSYAFGESTVGSMGSALYTPIEDYFGSNYTYLSRYDWSFAGVPITAGTDYLLFTIKYTYNGGALDGDDAWFNWNIGEDVFWDFDSGFIDALSNTPMAVKGGGPDYGPVTEEPEEEAKPVLTPVYLLLLGE